MRFLVSVFLLAVPLYAGELTRQELDLGWIQIFDGSTLFGWQPDGGEWAITKAGNIRASKGSNKGARSALRTTSPFGDFELRLVFRSESRGTASLGLRCVAAGPCGQTVPLRAASADWHVVEIRAEGDHVSAKVDSNPVDPVPGQGAFGAIELILENGEAVEFASLKLRPLTLRPVHDWHPFPGKTAFYSMRGDSGIHVEGGPGQLETRAEFGDFVLQFEAEIHSLRSAPNVRSGFFIRGVPGNLWSGYKIVLDNWVKEKNPKKPLDFGTGGIFGRQAARRIVSKDQGPLEVTVIANGPHIATWVDGYQETDWTEFADPKLSGTFSLQALEPATNVDFRKVRVQEAR